MRKATGYLVALRLGLQHERAAFGSPEIDVTIQGSTRTLRQYEELEDRAPDQRRHVDQMTVLEEFAQVRTNGLFGRRGGGAGIDDQDAKHAAVLFQREKPRMTGNETRSL